MKLDFSIDVADETLSRYERVKRKKRLIIFKSFGGS